LLESGLLGRKSGRRFYDYAPNALPDEPVKDATLGQSIVQRVLAMLVNEAVDAVYWRVATPADIELAMTRGVNYPKGLLAWGNDMGPAKVLEELEHLQAETGEDRYRPSPMLRRLVREHRLLPT
jgi:3-hydroxybutyryl-CoA dehydrogenase